MKMSLQEALLDARRDTASNASRYNNLENFTD